MVGRDHQDVALPHPGDEVGNELVELGGGGGVACHIAAVAVEHIEIDEVHEGQTLEVAGLQSLGEGDAVGVAGGLDLLRHALAVEDVENFAHGDDVSACVLEQIKHGLAGRLEAQVVAVGGAVEGVGGVAEEGAGDDAAHAALALQHLAGDLAIAVQLMHRHKLLVGGHLKHAVGAGVDDEGILLHGLLAVVLQHLCAGVGLVAEDFVAGLFLELVDEAVREAVREGGQRLGADDTGDLPVADGGILAHALLLQAGEGADGGGILLTGGHAVDVEQAEFFQVGAVEVGVVGDGAEGVGPFIAKGGGIRLCADAEAVQNDQKNALFHYAFTPFLSFCAHLCPFGAEVRLLLSPIIGDERTFRKRFIAPASITKI